MPNQKNMKIKFLGAALTTACLTATPGYSSTAVTAHVLNFGTYGNGNVYVSLDQTINEPGCSIPYIELPANGAAARAVLANAALAVALGVTITVQTDGCFNGVPSFTGARGA